MKPLKSVIKYAKENFNEVWHTTLNPEGPGVVRIHLIPPVYDEEEEAMGPCVAIINGQDIIPVNTSWAVLLCEFIKEVNKYEGKEVSEKDVENIINSVCTRVKKVFHLFSKKLLKADLYTIMNTFKQVAYGEDVTEDIEYISMGDYAPYMRAPHRMDLMVSAMTKEGKWHCNQSCVHCYAAGQELSEESELSTKDWKTIIDKLRDICVPQITFTGGEPTMREDLIELIDYSRWFVTRLNTNGIKLSKEYCQKLKDASLDSCQITFYSANEEVHNKLVGADRYKETLEGIENAVAAGLNISINTPLCTLNKDYVDTLKFLKEKGIIYVTCSGLIIAGNATNDESEKLQLSKEEIKKILKEACDYAYKNGMEISFTSPGWIEMDFFKELGMNPPTCGACLSNMAITPGGKIVPCQSWLDDEPLGDMIRDNWEDIWNSDNCAERRAYSAEMLGECPFRRA
ncbi:MAG: radical SAM protein [Lachnospiraceae bacterium]|nr:radical SAM protein [Lachnospiraceae bacterium]